jgi:hypothetical protein
LALAPIRGFPPISAVLGTGAHPIRFVDSRRGAPGLRRMQTGRPRSPGVERPGACGPDLRLVPLGSPRTVWGGGHSRSWWNAGASPRRPGRPVLVRRRRAPDRHSGTRTRGESGPPAPCFPRIPGRDQRWRPSTGPEAVQVRDGKAQVPHHDLATPVAGSSPAVPITGKVSPRLATHLRRRSACQ